MKLEEAGAREDPRERLKRLRAELAAKAAASAEALKLTPS
jgi:ATP-dependent DNA helicase Rep